MKVVSSRQMAYIEASAIRDGASEADLMEEAGSGVALVVNDYVDRHQLDRNVILVCGKGNNAGDAYVAGVHLLHLDFQVFALQLAPLKECSRLCQDNYHRFLEEGGRVKEINSLDEIVFPLNGIIVDGIFGTGFHGKASEPYATAIHMANKSHLPIIAVDIPSGLNGETGEIAGEAIIAAETAFLGLPKTGFFLREGWNHTGKLRFVDFGLPKEYIEESEADFIMLTKEFLTPELPPLIRNRHKYQAGYVVGLAGSEDMPGASMLASLAALRGGAGIVRLLHSEGMEIPLSDSPFELIKTPYQVEDTAPIGEALNKSSAIFIGPGLGRSAQIFTLLRSILPKIQKPSVIDADALYFLSEESDVSLPKNTILTPHLGELTRLLKLAHPQKIDSSFLKICQSYAEAKRVTLILKGGPTFIFHPDEKILVSPKGDPGMATAGSGDVLTGLLAALLAQGLMPREAAALGVYIHGLAGEHAANEMTSYCMIASDILYYFPEGFRLIEL